MDEPAVRTPRSLGDKALLNSDLAYDACLKYNRITYEPPLSDLDSVHHTSAAGADLRRRLAR